MRKFLKIVCISLVLVAFSCKKYEEGPSISFKTKKARITSAWVLQKVIKPDGFEVLQSEESKQKYTTVFFNDGTYYFRYETSFLKNLESGTWEFINRKNQIKVVVGNDIRTYEILLLKSKELGIKDISGNKYYYTKKEYLYLN